MYAAMVNPGRITALLGASLLSLFLIFCGSAWAETRILAWNVEDFRCGEFDGPPLSLVPEMAGFIADHDVDILCLTEVDSVVLRQLEAELEEITGHYWITSVLEQDKLEGQYYSDGLFDDDIFIMVNATKVSFRSMRLLDSVRTHSAYRAPLACRLYVRDLDEMLRLIVLHPKALGSDNTYDRQVLQYEALSDVLDEMLAAEPDTLLVVLGDWNNGWLTAQQRADVLAQPGKGVKDIGADVATILTQLTYQGPNDRNLGTTVVTYPDYNSALDHVATAGDWGSFTVEVTVFGAGTESEGMSDHYPVLITLASNSG